MSGTTLIPVLYYVPGTSVEYKRSKTEVLLVMLKLWLIPLLGQTELTEEMIFRVDFSNIRANNENLSYLAIENLPESIYVSSFNLRKLGIFTPEIVKIKEVERTIYI